MIDFILVVLLRVTILAGALLLIGVLLSRSRPGLRAALALASLAACVALPAWTPVVPGTAPVVARVPERDPVRNIFAPSSALSMPLEPRNQVPPKRDAGFDPKPILVGVWAAGVLLLLARLAFGLVSARLMAGRARREAIGGREYLVSDQAGCPMCLAWPVGAIVLPESALHLPSDQLDACLAHERHHAERRDPFKLVFGRVVRALCWPVPFVWGLEHQLRAALEEAADDAVVSLQPDSASGYAQLLRDLAVRRSSAEAAALTMVTPLMLKTRIQRILSSTADRRPVGPASRVLLSAGVLGIGAAAAFGVFLIQDSEFKYDDGKIKDPVIARTKSGKVIEIFEIQEDAYASGRFAKIAWRPDGTPVEKEDMFPLDSGLKPMENCVIVWARTRADGLFEPYGQVDRLIEGTNWMGFSGNSRTVGGWHYFNGIIRKPEGFLQSRVEGHLVSEPWRVTATLDAGRKSLGETGSVTSGLPAVESLSWNKGQIRVPDEEAMEKAYGHLKGQFQVMAISKVVEGMHLRIVMKEEWQPTGGVKIEVFDREGRVLPSDYSPGLAGLKGRQRGFGLALQTTPDQITKIVISERQAETFNAARIHLAPVK